MIEKPEEGIWQKAPLRWLRLIGRFELVALSLIIFFIGLGYFVVRHLFTEPEYLRQVAWEVPLGEGSYDTDYETLYDRYEVDLSLWVPVPDRLRGAHVSAVRQRVTRTIIREESQQRYLMAMHTSGLKPDFSCLTHSYTFTKDYSFEKPVGAEHMSRFTAAIDISDSPVGEPFDIEFLIYSWNAYQGEKNQSFGVYAKPGTKRLSFNFIQPRSSDRLEWTVEHYDHQRNAASPVELSVANFNAEDRYRVSMDFETPVTADGYFIRWKKSP